MNLSVPVSMNLEKMKTRLFELALQAEKEGEVPVAALIIKNNEIFSEAYNKKEQNSAVHHHAEILAIKKAAKKACNWRLNGYTIVVTLEPCVMCLGAILASRIDRLIYFAYDYSEGAFHGRYHLSEEALANMKLEVQSGLYVEETRAMMKSFFEDKR